MGTPRGRENCAWGCPPDAVVFLVLEVVSQSGAGALLEGLRTVATSTPVRLGVPIGPSGSPVRVVVVVRRTELMGQPIEVEVEESEPIVERVAAVGCGQGEWDGVHSDAA